MKRQFTMKPNFRPRLMGTTRFRASLLSVGAMLMAASLVQGARPGGVAILLPPFIPVQAPQPYLPAVSPFDIVGFIQSATVDTPADFFSAGWMEVNGVKIRIPRNTLFQMPATAMTWADMFMNAPAPYLALGQSGLALSDTPKPLTTYEVHVMGNRIINPTAGTDVYIAGLVYIAQQALSNGQGYINAIDYSTCATRVPAAPAGACMPDIWVGSTLVAKTGSRLRLNTPGNMFGAADALADTRFTADEGNPTVTARTGYPMCAPRGDPAVGNDPLCPQWNRPRDPFTGAFQVNFTFPAATAGAPIASSSGLPITHQVGWPTTTVHPDPFEQTPMEVGDFISYTGNLIQDVTPCVPSATVAISSCQYVSAHTVMVELGLYTAPSTWPVYAFASEFVFGVGGTPNPIFPQEAVEKIFGDFFTTDFSQLVDIYSEDVNSTTGVTSHRFYGSSDPFGPPLGGLKGRARFRVTVGNFLPPTRNMAAASRSLTGGAPIDTILPTAKLAANGVIAGFFTAPQFGYIFPENLILGTLQIPLTFQEFPFLVNGSGPYIPFDGVTPSPGLLGQLNPWPGLTAPAASANSTGLSLIQPPVANAGPPQTVPSGSTVTLSAAGSTDPNVPALPLLYTWQQLSGPAVAMLNVNNTQPAQSFVAPTLAPGAAPVVLAIQLAVCNGFTCGGAVTVNITVTSGAAPPPVNTVSLAVTSVMNAAAKTTTFTLTAACGGACPGTLTITQTAGTSVGALAGAGSTRTFTVTATKAFAPVTFTAKLSATGPTAAINVFDTITVTNVVYQLAHSKLQIACATNALPKGTAIIIATPLVNNKAVGADQVLVYDPVLDSYNLLADIVNPIPDGVNIRSTYGGMVFNSPVTRVR